MKLDRLSIAAGALLLLATAGVHSAGASMVSSWLEGERGAFLMLVWFVLAFDWAVVALVWLYCAWRGERSLRAVILLTALIPLATATGLTVIAGPGFFGIWMLAGASALAIFGALRLSARPG